MRYLCGSIVVLFPFFALAQTPAEVETHEACQEHATPAGYQAGWERCAAFEEAYAATVQAAREAASTQRANTKAARDARAQEVLNR